MRAELLAWLLLAVGCLATPQALADDWYRAAPGWAYQGQDALAGDPALQGVDGVSLTGGRFVHQTELTVRATGRYVLDFQNTSTIGRFHHWLFDSDGALVAELSGGIQDDTPNPFFLRHGRELQLAAGRYRLVTELDSPFFLAQPVPYLDELDHYREAIKPANALTLAGLGVFLGLGIYYAALSLARRRMADGMYALFILGNLLFNGSALLVFSQLFGSQSMYLVSFPILFSNCAYVAFVLALLGIGRDKHPRLHGAGLAALGLLGLFALVGVFQPHWSLELDRYGVGLFLLFGLTAGMVRARQGSITARLYLVAIGMFFVLGSAAISLNELGDIRALYVEHVGLLAVAVEVMLLALVLAYQFGQVHSEHQHALKKLAYSRRMARTDALTGLANRFALDLELTDLPKGGSLSFIDLDNLKFYNDRYGHARGDELLRAFADALQDLTGDWAQLYRVGGDEFAVLSPEGDVAAVERAITRSVARVRDRGFELAGASTGSSHVGEADDIAELKRLADLRMYAVKRQRKQSDLFADAERNA